MNEFNDTGGGDDDDRGERDEENDDNNDVEKPKQDEFNDDFLNVEDDAMEEEYDDSFLDGDDPVGEGKNLEEDESYLDEEVTNYEQAGGDEPEPAAVEDQGEEDVDGEEGITTWDDIGEPVQDDLDNEALENAREIRGIVKDWPIREVEDLKPEEYPPDYELTFRPKGSNQEITMTKEEFRNKLAHQSTKDVANELGYNNQTINRKAREIGLKLVKEKTAGFYPPNAEELEKVVRMAGSAKKLAKIVNVSPQTVQRACKEFNVDLQPISGTAGQTWHPSQEEMKKWFVDERMSVSELARREGVGKRTVRSRAKEYGFDTENLWKHRIDEKQFVKDFKQMESLTRIAEKYDMNRETVKAIARRLEIPENEWMWKEVNKSPFEDYSDDQLKQMINERTLGDIGEQFGLTESGVHYHLKRREIENPREKNLAPYEDARRVVENGHLSWNGISVAVNRKYANEYFFVDESKNGQELNLYKDRERKELVETVSLPCNELNPVFKTTTDDRVIRNKIESLQEDQRIELIRSRLDGTPVGELAKKYDIPYEEMEKLLLDNRITPVKSNIEDLKDFVNHYHPGAKILDDSVENSRDPIKIVCENDHKFYLKPNSLKDGNWCGECYKEANYISETKCREAIESIFDKEFKTVRIGERKLELDMYNEELNIAIEYNGKQHYEFMEYFHKTLDDFKKQQERDEAKIKLCEKQGINLIVVPYTVKDHRIKGFLIKELKKLGINIPRNKSTLDYHL